MDQSARFHNPAAAYYVTLSTRSPNEIEQNSIFTGGEDGQFGFNKLVAGFDIHDEIACPLAACPQAWICVASFGWLLQYVNDCDFS
jgi:hypothetical protein